MAAELPTFPPQQGSEQSTKAGSVSFSTMSEPQLRKLLEQISSTENGPVFSPASNLGQLNGSSSLSAREPVIFPPSSYLTPSQMSGSLKTTPGHASHSGGESVASSLDARNSPPGSAFFPRGATSLFNENNLSCHLPPPSDCTCHLKLAHSVKPSGNDSSIMNSENPPPAVWDYAGEALTKLNDRIDKIRSPLDPWSGNLKELQESLVNELKDRAKFLLSMKTRMETLRKQILETANRSYMAKLKLEYNKLKACIKFSKMSTSLFSLLPYYLGDKEFLQNVVRKCPDNSLEGGVSLLEWLLEYRNGHLLDVDGSLGGEALKDLVTEGHFMFIDEIITEFLCWYLIPSGLAEIQPSFKQNIILSRFYEAGVDPNAFMSLYTAISANQESNQARSLVLTSIVRDLVQISTAHKTAPGVPKNYAEVARRQGLSPGEYLERYERARIADLLVLRARQEIIQRIIASFNKSSSVLGLFAYSDELRSFAKSSLQLHDKNFREKYANRHLAAPVDLLLFSPAFFLLSNLTEPPESLVPLKQQFKTRIEDIARCTSSTDHERLLSRYFYALDYFIRCTKFNFEADSTTGGRNARRSMCEFLLNEALTPLFESCRSGRSILKLLPIEGKIMHLYESVFTWLDDLEEFGTKASTVNLLLDLITKGLLVRPSCYQYCLIILAHRGFSHTDLTNFVQIPAVVSMLKALDPPEDSTLKASDPPEDSTLKASDPPVHSMLKASDTACTGSNPQSNVGKYDMSELKRMAALLDVINLTSGINVAKRKTFTMSEQRCPAHSPNQPAILIPYRFVQNQNGTAGLKPTAPRIPSPYYYDVMRVLLCRRFGIPMSKTGCDNSTAENVEWHEAFHFAEYHVRRWKSLLVSSVGETLDSTLNNGRPFNYVLNVNEQSSPSGDEAKERAITPLDELEAIAQLMNARKNMPRTKTF